MFAVVSVFGVEFWKVALLAAGCLGVVGLLSKAVAKMNGDGGLKKYAADIESQSANSSDESPEHERQRAEWRRNLQSVSAQREALQLGLDEARSDLIAAKGFVDDLRAQRDELRERLESQPSEAMQEPQGEFQSARGSWVELCQFLAAHGHGQGSKIHSEMMIVAGVIDRREDEVEASAAIAFPNFDRDSKASEKPIANPTNPTIGPAPAPVIASQPGV